MQVRNVIAKKLSDLQGHTFENGTYIWCDETERLYINMKNKIIAITPGKREILELKCKNCGAPLPVDGTSTIVVCKFCGSVYDIDNYDMSV